MHWHQVRSQISQVFQVTSHVVGIFALHFVSSIQVLSLYQFIQFLTCTRIPCRDSHCENGLVRCCLYTSRRLQQTAVSCERSICNKIREKIVKVARLRFYPKTANNGSLQSIMSLARKHMCGLSLNYYELHQESLHCHQLEEELDDWCQYRYFQNGTGLSRSSPHSR